jgi:hypothetical protein
MKFDSKYFDRIRIRSRQPEEPEQIVPPCAWEGCEQPGNYRAPKGNRAEGEYHHFCLEHVRHYNQVFNFFAGMKPEEMERTLHRERETDGRPSWGMGAKPGASAPHMPKGAPRATADKRFNDAFGVFARYRRYQQKAETTAPKARARPVNELDRRAFETLGFSTVAPPDEIRGAYKSLVKLHHPDVNGGDKSAEDRLRAVISAYTHLKQKGFVGK